MTAKSLLTEALKRIGATGLCRDGCGCEMPDLMPCESDPSMCVPALRRKCAPDCDHCDGAGCMVPLPVLWSTECATCDHMMVSGDCADDYVPSPTGRCTRHSGWTRRAVAYEQAIRETLEDNGHLSDGEDCTLIKLKRVLSANAGIERPMKPQKED